MTCLVLDGSASYFKPTIHAVVAYVHMKMAAKIYAHMKKIFFSAKSRKLSMLDGSAECYMVPQQII